MRRQLLTGTALVLGLALGLPATAQAAPTAGTIYVPDDFAPEYSSTRLTGTYEVEGTGLRVRTQTSNDKVAEYVVTDTPLADVGEPVLEYTSTAGAVPGFQLVVDFDGNGTPDGILVGEPVYDGDWWLNRTAAAIVKEKAPQTDGGSGSEWHGTLDEWRAAFPKAEVDAFGFSLGSGPTGDGVIDAIEFAGTRYTFAEHVVLGGKDECKDGGWATSTKPTYRNQGQCVSSFASAGAKPSPAPAPVAAAQAAASPVEAPAVFSIMRKGRPPA